MLFASYRSEKPATDSSSLLIVDDDPAVRRLLNQQFQQGYRLTFAETDARALAELEQQTFDLVLIGVDAPNVNGFELLRRLRAEPTTDDLPVMLIATLEDNSRVVQGLHAGANDYLTKPLDVDVVRARIETQLALKRVADERKQTIAELRFTQEMQENFTRIVSHDLKGPLTNIRMAQFMLRDIMQENEQAQSILDNMDVTLDGMVEMIRVFLDAMDSQQLEPVLAPQDALELVYNVIEQYRMSAERKEIELRMTDCSGVVLADHRLLRQVLCNLVSNAIKFSPQQTQTTLSTEQRGDVIRFSVADQGPGIPPDEWGQLFTMFSKLSVRPTGGESSTGLGLWIVKSLTELQGGRVGADQREGGGSIFWVELPAVSGESPARTTLSTSAKTRKPSASSRMSAVAG